MAISSLHYPARRWDAPRETILQAWASGLVISALYYATYCSILQPGLPGVFTEDALQAVSARFQTRGDGLDTQYASEETVTEDRLLAVPQPSQ
ncbi:MAG: hypothetical protein C3F10_04665 [Dehalococcoidia bacterium]|jgi:hypothetical protein|nr:MAG: hypothetical protein C3F10_04665 [Dehalococcoidia bacterium]